MKQPKRLADIHVRVAEREASVGGCTLAYASENRHPEGF